ncbi:MAG: hypothetical protein P8O22_09940 [Akkermansiaceae bacterium]|nr:hypothetical protein [Akkermansiaceae bacterium]
MNVTQVLLGSTAVMLLVALVLSFTAMKNGEAEDGREHTAVSLMSENARLQAEIERLRAGDAIAAPVTKVDKPDGMSQSELEVIMEKNRILASQLEAAKKKQTLAEQEAAAITERQSKRHDKEARRARLISQAMLMAQVKEVAKDDDAGIHVIVLDVKIPEQVRIGTELAVRRGTGIIGRLSVSSMTDGNVFADPLPGTFPGGTIDIKTGDELIKPPL